MKKWDDAPFTNLVWKMFENEYECVLKDNERPTVEIEIKNTPPEQLKYRKQVLLYLNIDNSCIMYMVKEAVKNALVEMKKDIISSGEVDKIQISKGTFSDRVRSYGYVSAEKLNLDFSVTSNINTLYDSIIYSQREIESYSKELKNAGIDAKPILCIVCASYDNGSKSSFDEAKAAIEKMIESNITVCFVALENSCGLANELGIKNIITIDTSYYDIYKVMKFITVSAIKKAKELE